MTADKRNEIPWPPTPASPVRSYYRCAPPYDHFWAYYNGETWVGDPVRLPWYRVPVPWARGRAPRWAVLATFGAAGVVVVLSLIAKLV